MFLRFFSLVMATAATVHATSSCCLDFSSCSELPSEKEIQQLSTTFGHLVSSNMENPVLSFDLDQVIQGMHDQAEGKAPPMDIARFEEVITHLEEMIIQQIAEDNLCDSEEFLRENGTRSGITEVVEGKVQYQTITEGSGNTLTASSTPRIRYRATTLDGNVIGDSTELSEDTMTLPMAHLAPGLQKGMEGMRIGETRKIFVHPEMTYEGWEAIAPNSLITFEVQLVGIESSTDTTSESIANLATSSEETIR